MREYQVELMVAAQDDEGSTMRIEELERRKNLAESVAQRIFDKGMIMREEYPDQVQNLRRLLDNTEQWIRQMECDSEFAQSVTKGRQMQNNLEQSVMNFRRQSEIAASSNVDLQIVSQPTAIELRESQSEVEALRHSLELAQRNNQFNEDNVKKIIGKCRLKVSEANQQRMESGHKVRTLLNEAELRREKAKESEAQALADLMLRAQESAGLHGQVRRLEAMLKVEAATSNDYWNKLQEYVSRDPEGASARARPAIGSTAKRTQR